MAQRAVVRTSDGKVCYAEYMRDRTKIPGMLNSFVGPDQWLIYNPDGSYTIASEATYQANYTLASEVQHRRGS